MRKNKIVVDVDDIDNSCFVIMPFAPMYEREYSQVIKPAIESLNLICVRGDEIYSKESIVQDIWKEIRNCRVVVAELSGRNPNVMYEVGLAHAIGKPIVLLTRDEGDVPFDLKSLRYICYNIENPEWGMDLKESLRKSLEKIINNKFSPHLEGVLVAVENLEPPDNTSSGKILSVEPISLEKSRNFGGIWRGEWVSIRKERKHQATLIVPESHGMNFSASMTVFYEIENKMTTVEESFKCSVIGEEANFVGVNYTYVEQGNSRGYSLDNMYLKTHGNNELLGTIKLKFGDRRILFRRAGT